MPIEHVLTGCKSVPLAHYLKALGVLRLVAGHPEGDPHARARWSAAGFHLTTRFAPEQLEDFLLHNATFTPIVAPWNGGSGFGPKDNREAIDTIAAGAASRFAPYRETIAEAHRLRAQLGITDKVEDRKGELLAWCRARFPDAALPWLDAAVVITSDRLQFPPLLGTGGNDGRLDFTNNNMQRLLDLFDPETGDPRASARDWLRGALNGGPIDGLLGGRAIGQFQPAGAGGANAGPGFDADSLVNPWDFVLMLEGAVCFASAAVRRLESAGPAVMSIPFTVRAVGAGYGSATKADERDARHEIWLPLWDQPATLAELIFVFAEGRASVKSRPAVTGLDFARAAKTLGVDRGLSAFERYGFQVRNGLAYFATPLGRHLVAQHAQPKMRLLDDLEQDDWLARFRRWAGGNEASGAAGRVLQALESALFAVCDAGERAAARDFQQVTLALGAAQATMVRAGKKAFKEIPPVPPISEGWWGALEDDSEEFDLAAALAGLGKDLRLHVEPVKVTRWDADRAEDPALVWLSEATLEANLIAVARRWLIESMKLEHATERPFKRSARHLKAASLLAFLSGETDDARVAALLRGLMLIRAAPPHVHAPRAWEEAPLPALYCLAKLCCLPSSGRTEGPLAVLAGMPPTPGLLHQLAAGHGAEAWREAARRLRGAGFPPAVDLAPTPDHLARRIAAALVFDLPDVAVLRVEDDPRSPRPRFTGLGGRVLRRPSSPEVIPALAEGVVP